MSRTPRSDSRRYGWGDLIAGLQVPIRDATRSEPTRFDYARLFNVNPTTIDRWRRTGLSWISADTVAVKCLGMHPSLIWPTWFDED